MTAACRAPDAPAPPAAPKVFFYDPVEQVPGQPAIPNHLVLFHGRLAVHGGCFVLVMEGAGRVAPVFPRGSAAAEGDSLVIEGHPYAVGEHISFGGPAAGSALGDSAQACGGESSLTVNRGSSILAG